MIDKMASPPRRPDDDILIEMFRVGNAVKVSAVDPKTGIEASIVGSPSMGEETLKRNAVNKLMYVMRKRGEGRDA
ncbi:MAG: hypothetical protein VW713_10870 [Alphaproteobacteria bacterium]